jgi:hypothetical protein
MLEGRSAEDLRAIAANGGGLEINGGSYNTDDLRTIAASMSRGGGAVLVIHNSKTKATSDLCTIAANAKGKVIFA